MDARRADLAFGIMMASSLALTVVFVVLALCSSAVPLSLLSGGIMMSVWIGAFVFFVASFSAKFVLAEIPVSVEMARPVVARALRQTGSQVSTEGESIVVRVDSLSSVRLTFTPSPKGTLVRAQAWATPTGWSVTIVFLFVWYFSIATLIATAYIFRRSMRHSVDSLLPVIAGVCVDVFGGRELDIRSALLEGLSEAKRLASEAYEGTRSNYQDSILLVAVGGIMVFLISLMAAMSDFFGLLQGPVDVGFGMAVSGGLVMVFVAAFLWLARARYRRVLLDLRSWAVGLEAAFQMESSGTMPVDSQRSTIEILADAWKELPKWLSARRKSSMFREPGVWLVMFALVNSSWSFLMIGIMALSVGFVYGAYSLLAGSGMIAGAVYLYARWRKKRGAEDSRTKREWTERSRMLEDLLGREFLRS